MKRSFAFFISLVAMLTAALAASEKRPAPAGTFKGAPAEYTHFTANELTRGFIALAFGSDLHMGALPKGIHRFERPIRVLVIGGGSVDRAAAMQRIVGEYRDKVPGLRIEPAADAASADVEVRLIDEKNFHAALTAAFGPAITKRFVAKTDPQCMTHVASKADGDILRSISFIIVDKGDDVFLDCAYHELLHAFGFSNHDPRNPWTALKPRRMVGYLTAYDRALLTLLYDKRITPGMTPREVRSLLPKLIGDLGLAEPAAPGQKSK